MFLILDTIILPSETPPVYQGSLDYEGDKGFFILTITEAGNYRISFAGYIKVGIITWDGEFDFWNDNETIYLDSGDYYIQIYNIYSYIVDSYTFMLIVE